MTHRITIPRVAALLGVCALAASATAQQYQITSLGNIYGPSQAGAINSSGHAAGAAIGTIGDHSPFRAFYWDGVLHAVEPLAGDLDSHAIALDDAGTLVGNSFTIGKFSVRAFLADAGAPVYLGSFIARGANNAGQVVGQLPGADAAGWRTMSACLYDSGNLYTLPGLGGLNALAVDIAENGDTVGHASLVKDKVTHATLWRGGAVHDLGTLGGPRSRAFAVNEFGLVAGTADTGAGDPHACLFQVDGAGNVVSRTDLGVLGERSSYAYGLDSTGRVVGSSDDRAFLWDGGQLLDLNDHIPANSGWHLQAATAINESGQIVGWGRILGVPTAFLLSPGGCLADFNGDGSVNTIDVLAFLNAWSTGDSSADINGDGAVDTLDVLAFLNLWSAGC